MPSAFQPCPPPEAPRTPSRDTLDASVDALAGRLNWRAGVSSALVRGNIFLATNLHAGALSASRALLAKVFSAVFSARP